MKGIKSLHFFFGNEGNKVPAIVLITALYVGKIAVFGRKKKVRTGERILKIPQLIMAAGYVFLLYFCCSSIVLSNGFVAFLCTLIAF